MSLLIWNDLTLIWNDLHKEEGGSMEGQGGSMEGHGHEGPDPRARTVLNIRSDVIQIRISAARHRYKTHLYKKT